MKSRPTRVNPPLRAWAAGLGLALLAAVPARASELAGVIEEVVAGAFGRPEIQYVELQSQTCFGFPWAGVARIAAYNAADQEVGAFVFPSEPAIVCDFPVPVLVATQAFADLPGAPAPDFLMAPILAAGSGKVCFEVPAESVRECLTYGSFAGVSHQGSPFNAPPLSPDGICSLQINNPQAFADEAPFNADYDLLPPAPTNSEGQTGTLVVPPRFVDVPAASPFLPFVEALFNAGVTGGCGNGAFCPSSPVSRAQMAVFLLLAKEGADFRPPACLAPVFADVPCSHPFAAWINELAARGITGGCGGGNYCPGAAVSRDQMAVFLLLAKEGADFQPPACTVPAFSDVPCSSPFAPWIDELAARGVTGGCGGDAYCPGNPVSREQMAVFLSTVFELPVPSRSCLLPPVVDDHGDTPDAATPVVPVATAPGLSVTGNLERPRDRDVFSFPAQAGQSFLFTLSPPAGGAPQVEVAVEGPAAVRAEGTTFVGFTAQNDGTQFFTVRDPSGRGLGGYEVFVRGPVLDDHGDEPGSATPLTAGGASAAGEIGGRGDADLFSFAATAGEVYVVEALGTDPAIDPFLTIVTAGGGLLAESSFSLEDAGDEIERLAFRAPATGTFFADVRDRRVGVGRYQVRVLGPIADDHGGTPATATPLSPGVPVDGEVLPEDDVDLFAFAAAAGDGFYVGVEVLPTYPEALEVRIVDAAGEVQEIVFQQEDPRMLFAASSGGPFFVRVRPLGDAPVLYRVSLEGPLPDDHGDTPATATALTPGAAFLPGRNEVPGDVDVFSFPAVAGQSILLQLDQVDPSFGHFVEIRDDQGNPLDDGWDLRFELRAPKTGTFYAAVRQNSSGQIGSYRIRVRVPVADDHGNRPSQSSPLVPNAPALAAELELTGDSDVFFFDALAGETYVVKAEGSFIPVFTGGLEVTVLDGDGLTVLVAAEPVFFTAAQQALFRAPRTGRFYVRVGSSEPQLYRISLAGPFPDDHGNTAATATALAVDGPAVPGVLESAADEDVFSFDAVAGESVTVETAGLGQGLDTLLAVEAAGGSVLATDDDGGTNFGSRITFTAPATGSYRARVTGFSGSTGTYHISARR